MDRWWRIRILDWLLAGALAALAIVELWAGEPRPAHPVATSGIALVMTGSLIWRRRAPMIVLAVVLLMTLALAWVEHSVSPLYVLLATLVVAYSVGAHCEWRNGLTGVGLAAAAVWVGLWMDPARHDFADYPFALVLVAGTWAFGAALRARELRATRLQLQGGEYLARQAVLEERARIARELHDVIAHSVSVMVVQTGLVRRRIARDRGEEGQLLGEVEQLGRQALDEMRRLLGLLRTDGDDLALSPQPGMAQLTNLVEQLRASGVLVDLRVTGDEVSLQPGLDLAAYRIVQEALTNVLKHGAGSPARLTIDYGTQQVSITVDNPAPDQSVRPDHVGHGMVGMRERAALYGGTLEAGHRPDGSFSVHATLPMGPDRSPAYLIEVEAAR